MYMNLYIYVYMYQIWGVASKRQGVSPLADPCFWPQVYLGVHIGTATFTRCNRLRVVYVSKVTTETICRLAHTRLFLLRVPVHSCL